MRGMVGRLCHGRERKPLEPYGWLAPFVRMLAWGTLLVAALGGLAMIALVLAGTRESVYLVPGRVMAIGLPLAVGLRILATYVRPYEIAPTAWEIEVTK